MDVEISWDIKINQLEKGEDVFCSVLLSRPVDDFAGPDVQGGEEVDRAVALVVVGHRAGTPLSEWQARLGAVEGLDLGLLVEAEHDGPLGRVEDRARRRRRLSSKCGSFEILNVSVRHGFNFFSRSCQMRATVSLPIPNRLASILVVQCVEPSSGRSWHVTLTTSATVPSVRTGFRPRPFAITPTPSTPFSTKRFRQRRTASGSTPQRRAISSLATPSAASISPRAWFTLRCGSVLERAICCN